MSGAERDREVVTMDGCWACAGSPVHHCYDCARCGAPGWVDVATPGGVYVVSAYSGLWKIGIAGRSIIRRVAELDRRSTEPLRLERALYGADERVERWLHRFFADANEVVTAREYGLPHPTEWFANTRAFDRFVQGRPFTGGAA